MSETKKKSELPQPEAAFTQAPGYQSVYANNVNLFVSFQDIAMTFGEIFGVDNGVLQVQNKCRVVMSPQQFKMFSLALHRQFTDYETKFGAINLPEGIAQAEGIAITRSKKSRR